MTKLLHSDQQLLRDWAIQVVQLFNGAMCYQVGSSTSGESYRDIDVRTMLKPEEFKALQRLVNIDRLNLTVSLWGQRVTGLPIDFQVQDQDYANTHHSGPRSAIGIGGIAQGDGYDDWCDLCDIYTDHYTEAHNLSLVLVEEENR